MPKRPARPGPGIGGTTGRGGGGILSLLFGRNQDPYENVDTNPLFTQEGEDFRWEAANAGVPLSQQEIGQPFQDTRGRFLGFGPRMGHNNAASLNAMYGATGAFNAQDSAQKLSDANAMLPVEQQRGLNATYGAQGMYPTAENIAAATQASNAAKALSTQQSTQQRTIGASTFPFNRATATRQAQQGATEAGVRASYANTPAARAAIEAGQQGQYLTPAGQAFKLFSTELPANTVSYTERAKQMGVSPYREGVELTTQETPQFYRDAKTGQAYPIPGASIHSQRVRHPAGFTEEDVNAAKQRVIAPMPAAGVPAGYSTPPDDRGSGDSTPILNPSSYGQPSSYRQPGLFNQASDVMGNERPTPTKKVSQGGRTGQVADTSDKAMVEALTKWLGESNPNVGRAGGSEQLRRKDVMSKVRALLENYYEQ